MTESMCDGEVAGTESRAQYTLTRSDIADAIERNSGLSWAEAYGIVTSMVETMREAIAEDGKLKIVSFGTFEIRDKGVRTGRNPKTGEPYPISARRIVAFRASPILKNRTSRSAYNLHS